MLNMRWMALAAVAGGVLAAAGCVPPPTQADLLRGLVVQIDATIDGIQNIDPTTINLPDAIDAEGEVDLGQAGFLDSLEGDLANVDLSKITVLGFENETASDVLVTYKADDAANSVWILSGRTLFLVYDCLTQVLVETLTDVDPDTGEARMYEIPPGQSNPWPVTCESVVIFRVVEDRVTADVFSMSL